MYLPQILQMRATALECWEASELRSGGEAKVLQNLAEALLGAATDLEIKLAGHQRTPANVKRLEDFASGAPN